MSEFTLSKINMLCIHALQWFLLIKASVLCSIQLQVNCMIVYCTI